MARGIHLLIQLAQRQMDERRVELQHAASACAESDAAIVDHEQRVANEARSAATDTATLITLGAWTRHASNVRSDLRARHAELRGDEAAARDHLRDAFVDLKRLELVQDHGGAKCPSAVDTSCRPRRRRSADPAAGSTPLPERMLPRTIPRPGFRTGRWGCRVFCEISPRPG